mmetsp:Transcript_32948/g.57769  ORF Transcript_32948/g.57769 Transcript_32948/m.57769 type:complete len:402 (+) Transcript_32948:1362-2567(+)
MAERGVFECAACHHVYDSQDRLPLSLPCGHVACKPCLYKHSSSGRTACPFDKLNHSVSVDKLPCCFAILTNLPKERSRDLCCNRHPRKKLKFLCKVHTAYLCSDCVIDHAGTGHEVVSFSMTVEQLRRDLQEILTNAQELIKDIKKSVSSQHSEEKQLSQFYEGQMLKVNSVFDLPMRNLSKKRQEHIDNLTKHLKDQLGVVEMYRMRSAKRIESTLNWATEVKSFSDKVDMHPYEDVAKFIASKTNELGSLKEGKGGSEPDLKYYVFTDTMTVKETGSVTLLRQAEETWSCSRCSLTNKTSNFNCEACGLTYRDDGWKCKHCGFNNSNSTSSCGFCKHHKSHDFSSSQGPEASRYGYSPRHAKENKLAPAKKSPRHRDPKSRKLSSKKRLVQRTKRNNSF